MRHILRSNQYHPHSLARRAHTAPAPLPAEAHHCRRNSRPVACHAPAQSVRQRPLWRRDAFEELECRAGRSARKASGSAALSVLGLVLAPYSGPQSAAKAMGTGTFFQQCRGRLRAVIVRAGSLVLVVCGARFFRGGWAGRRNRLPLSGKL